uniref:Uncharacterized protein n=1 Tax=Utricularia reniformis TaxID=192314 RepID=A0A1Y0B4S7_9LAMI|nr:hypothetical protein AEK19_MT2259 [Utricularia reniformis]ART32403.1 hypothetical protein AEK19_MT2259 [Utricularia reniformis]
MKNETMDALFKRRFIVVRQRVDALGFHSGERNWRI